VGVKAVKPSALPARTLSEALSVAARAAGDRLALVCGDRRIHYPELDAEASWVAAALLARGLHRGDRVALLFPTGWDGVRMFFGVTRAGMVAVPVDPVVRPRELRRVLADAAPAAIVSTDRVATNDLVTVLGEVRDAPGCPKLILFTAGDPPPWAWRFEHVEPAGRVDEPGGELDDVAAIFYTSGTTGVPKGVTHTHGSLLESFLAMHELQQDYFAGSPAQVLRRGLSLLRRYRGSLLRGFGWQTWLTALPGYRIAGFRVVLNCLLSGHRLVLMSRFNPRAALALIDRERVSVLATSPSMLEAILRVTDLSRYQMSSLTVVGLGAAPANPGTVRRARELLRCPVVVGYGSTETGGGVLVTRLEDSDEQMAQTVGRPFPGVEVRIVDEHRRPVPPGEVGELACRSPGLMTCYRGDPDGTAAVVDGEGWYYTGDLAVQDRQGYVRIDGRTRDLIIRGGHNVVPTEVEAVLEEHPTVSRAAVIGLPDPLAGEIICAFVAARNGTVDLAAVRRYCAERLAPYKLPDQLRVTAELPVSDTGELARSVLRDEALQDRR